MVSITFSDPRIEQGIGLIETVDSSDESYTEHTVLGDDGCRYVSPGKYAALNVNDMAFSEKDGHILVNIIYKGGTGSFILEYYSTSSTYKTVEIKKDDRSEWPTASLMIADADFSGNQVDGVDIKLFGEVYIKSVSIQTHVSSDVSLIFSKPIISNGMQFVINTDQSKEAYTEEAVVDGVQCRYIPITDKRKYGYFKADDNLIKTEDTELTFELTYYDGNSKLQLQYNSLYANYEKLEIIPSNTKQWVTKIIPIKDAAFANAQNNKSDFRIHGDVYIRRVAVRKGFVPITVSQVDSTEVSNQVIVSHIKKFDETRIKIFTHSNTVQVNVSEEFLGSDILIYNVLGETLLHEKASQTQNTLNINAKPGLYIVSVGKNSFLVNKKFVVR